MFVSSSFLNRVLIYIFDIKDEIDNIAGDTFDMDRAERLRNLSSRLSHVITAIQRLNHR